MYQYHCLNPISETGLNMFSSDYRKTDSVEDADAILVRSAKMHDMELPESVVAVARAGAGVNNIPIDEYAKKGIVVFNTPGANANGVKELVLAGMLLASRDIVGGIEWVAQQKDKENIDKLAEKQKKQFAGCEISGKKTWYHRTWSNRSYGSEFRYTSWNGSLRIRSLPFHRRCMESFQDH